MRLGKAQEEKTATIDRYNLMQESLSFLFSVAKETQKAISLNVSELVNLALNLCFPGEYRFKLEFVEARGKVEARCLFEHNGNDVSIMDATGGGVVDVCAFALRLSCYVLTNAADTIILDEPFRFVSVDLRPRVAGLVKELSEKLNVQFIIVTHDSTIVDVADEVFRVSKKEGVAHVDN